MFEFTAHPLLRNPHAMTIIPRYWPRRGLLRGIPREARLFSVDQNTQLLGQCHWQADRKSAGTVVLVHGLEGCSESHYMRAIAGKAWRAGLNVIRLNQRTCGGTEHLTRTLYNSGLSEDYRAVVTELSNVDGFEHIWLLGYSMGGNLVLKAAGEAGSSLPALRGVLAVCPNIDPAQCVAALEQPRNRLYHDHFLSRLKARLLRKAALLPGKWDVTGLRLIKMISEFDDRFTAPDGGYANGADYYDRSGARHVMSQITVPTLIITAQDDPFIPYRMFTQPNIQGNRAITLIAPINGGHCGFFQRRHATEDSYWAENRLVEILMRGDRGAHGSRS
jgi:uncharacterized protein